MGGQNKLNFIDISGPDNANLSASFIIRKKFLSTPSRNSYDIFWIHFLRMSDKYFLERILKYIDCL